MQIYTEFLTNAKLRNFNTVVLLEVLNASGTSVIKRRMKRRYKNKKRKHWEKFTGHVHDEGI